MRAFTDYEPRDWTAYNTMMQAREAVNFSDPTNCQKCGRPWGNHLSEHALAQNPRACRFVKKFYPKLPT